MPIPGSMAIRQAVAAGTSMTYKILVNSAVAMTGGQTPEGELGVPEIAAQVAAEGVGKIVVVSDDPDRHQSRPADAEGHRPTATAATSTWCSASCARCRA